MKGRTAKNIDKMSSMRTRSSDDTEEMGLAIGQEAIIMNAERETMVPMMVFLRFAAGERSAMMPLKIVK
jgi:hypothetical protein